jgi:hypothetical protein
MRFSWKSLKERDHLEDLYVGGRIILKWNLEKYNGVIWTSFIWLRMGTSGAVL